MSTTKNFLTHPQLQKRHKKSHRFKWYSTAAIISAIVFLFFFLGNMVYTGLPAFKQSYMKIEVSYTEKALDNPRMAVEKKYRRLVSRAWLRNLPLWVDENPDLMGKSIVTWALCDDQVDQYMKDHVNKLKDKQIAVVEKLKSEGNIKFRFNTVFFAQGDSKSPEYAGIFSAFVGSILTLLVTIAFAFPIGVMTSMYLEEFAPQNRLTEIIEININNLAAIPSILFGLLGLAIFINFFGVPRSSALVGGLTLGLMTLPIIIVSSRAALRTVPESIREAGFALGLTRWQILKDHVLPLAFPGILTGLIIGLAQAIGETAPLIIIGMIAFIPDAPDSILDAATVLPAQIFTWAGMPEITYVEKTAAGILVLLTVMITLNATAVLLRKKYERKW